MKEYFYFTGMIQKILLLLFISVSSICFAQLGNSNMRLLSNLNQHVISGREYSALWGYLAPNGREYAIMGCYDGTTFVDITDTTNIHEVDYLPGPVFGNNSHTWREMKTFSHYCYIVNDVINGAMQIVDLQYLPDSVHLVRNFTFGSFNRGHTISQEGPYLYISGGNASTNGGIRILDLTSNPELPTVRGQWTTRYVHDCRVKNDTIFACNIWTGEVTVINAANKDNPVQINFWFNNPNGGPHNCALTPNRQFCLVADEINGNPRLLKIWNIQNLNNVIQVSTWQPTGITNTIVHNVEVYGNYALVAHYEAGLRILNITNPAAPVEIAWYDTFPSGNGFDYRGCWGVYMFPSQKIIASDMQTGLYVFKTSTIITSNQNNQNSSPAKFELKQNYPNPFNPTTRIEFSIPKASHVSLKVFDALGKHVATLADEFRNVGNYSVSYDAARLASGVYFYNLVAGDYKESRKMVLIK